MPPSSNPVSNILNEASQSSKPAQQEGGGVRIPTKNGRKNGTAKDGGGGAILAAVTKNASKMPSAKAPSGFGNRPAVYSPETNAVVPPPNGNPVTSPLLDALSSAALDRSPSQNTNEWARSVPAYSGSPSNLIHLGESPPTIPSSYEDRLATFGWNTREQRGIPSGHLPSASPPSNSRRRPLSYQLDGNYPQGLEDHRSQISSYAPRRSSMYSQQSRYTQNPPLPHQAQSHFYGVSDTSMRYPQAVSGLTAGDNGYYCGFDSLCMPFQNPSRTAENVVLMGYDGGLHVYAFSKRGARKVLGIDALRGGVFNAKILPWSLEGPASRNFPMVAMVIHGPASTTSDTSSAQGSETLDSPPLTQNGSIRGSPRLHLQPSADQEPVEHYQTTVEIYSLNTKQHVTTLLFLPKHRLNVPTSSPRFKPPQAEGALTIRADCGNVVVASGSTGETWIFRQGDLNSPSGNKFKCIGKIWTAVQHGTTPESPVQAGPINLDWPPTEATNTRKPYKASIISMNGRWLAYCPSSPSSHISLHAVVPGLPTTARVPGLNSQTPPQLPPTNCFVETPGGESMAKQLLQTGTQKFIEAGNYLAQQGVLAWKNYQNRPSPSSVSNGPASYQPNPPAQQHFPPTHGIAAPAPLVAKDPGLVSILDLNTLARNASNATPHPLATFRVPHGCSFLSFSPNGLALFTASSKGDVQTVWDLMRLHYSKSSFLKGALIGGGPQGSHVRQIAQFTRMTVARIVDVVWTSPHGERAAMVTEPGTVHILDLPASAFAWPPPRRRAPPSKPHENVGEPAGVASAATRVASNAVNSLWAAAIPLVSRRRRSSVGMSGRTVAAQAGHGTQALAAGISRSVGAATGKMNEMRKSVATKLHVPRGPVVPSRGCILLLNRRQNDLVIVVGNGNVRTYTIKNRRADRPADHQKASRNANLNEFPLEKLPDFKFSLERAGEFQQAEDFEITERDMEDSRWKERKSPIPKYSARSTDSSIPQAEIESNAPYQPFHTDRRIALHVYAPVDSMPDSPSVSALFSPSQPLGSSNSTGLGTTLAWAFGEPIKSTKLDVGPPHNADDDLGASADYRALPSAAMERVTRVTDSTEDVEQIVITTRRRKGLAHSGGNSIPGDEEGFFEDDCEVLDFASSRV